MASNKTLKLTQFQDDEALTTALSNILACFTGEDGGATFVNFCTAMQQFSRRARFGDANSIEIIKVVLHFSRLIEVTNELTKEQYDREVAQQQRQQQAAQKQAAPSNAPEQTVQSPNNEPTA